MTIGKTEVIRGSVQLEVLAANEDGQPVMADAIVTFLGDEMDQLWVQLYDVPGRVVRLPLLKLEEAIEVAKAEVHGEAWYDRSAE